MSSNESDPFEYPGCDDLEPQQPALPDYTLEHALVEHDHHPDEYAVTPIDTEPGVLTTWLTIDVADACDLTGWR
ncbi:DUF7511 domain-containing protein [Natrinema ejinorense]|uniref:DUF7511 domain-containing protein n=1 Tax=Natrinema ejinorense TaxID=373386 RepID=A0A2A5QPA0_9EURY|nr:hypothetical protein [Natrinema ejinorense]PCR88657.1 hypothetical protein CP557_21745 [Natrinema ejinorense]